MMEEGLVNTDYDRGNPIRMGDPDTVAGVGVHI